MTGLGGVGELLIEERHGKGPVLVFFLKRRVSWLAVRRRRVVRDPSSMCRSSTATVDAVL